MSDWELPEGWTNTTFETVSKLIPTTEKKLALNQSKNSGKFPVVDQGHRFISGYSDNENLVIHSLPVILFGDHTRVVKWLTFPFVPGADGTKIIKASEGIYSKYLYYFTTSVELPNRGYSRHYQFLTKANFPLPPLPEQKRIVAKLDTLLGKLGECQARLDRIPALLKRFRKSVLAAATSGKLTEEWREEKGITEEWKRKTGKEVFNFITSGSRGWAQFYSDSGSIFLRVGNLNRESIDLDMSQIQYVNPPSNSEGERTRLCPDDIVISITADVGMVAHINQELGTAFINQHLCLARPSNENFSKFLAYFLCSPTGGKKQISKLARGATKSGLTLGDIRDLIILLPSITEQHEIVRRVESLLAQADRIEARYHEAKTRIDRLQPALLAKAFRGELVPQDPADEPASVLLERIRALSGTVEGEKRGRKDTASRKGL